MALQVGKLHGQASIAGALETRAARPFAEPREEDVDRPLKIARQPAPPMADAGKREFRVGLQGGGEEIVLAAEVVVERPLGYAGPRGDRVEPDAGETVPIEELVGGLQDGPASLIGGPLLDPVHVYRGVSLQAPTAL